MGYEAREDARADYDREVAREQYTNGDFDDEITEQILNGDFDDAVKERMKKITEKREFKTRLNKTYDPWNLLGLERPSKHCEGKQERIFEYVHTGEMRWECECGNKTGWE